MTTLSDKFGTLEGLMADQNTAILATMTNLILANNANTSRIIAALEALACPCDTTGPLLPPASGDTPPDASGAALCQRIQFFDDLFRLGWIMPIHDYVRDAGSISSAQVGSLLNAALAERSITTGQLAAGLPSSVGISVSTAIGSTLAAHSSSAAMADLAAMALDTDLWTAVQTAIFGATNAGDALTAADVVFNSSENFATTIDIIKRAFYSAWTNDMFNSVPVVDASGYDGSACGDGPCDTLNSFATTASDPSFPALTPRQVITFPDITARFFTFLETTFGDSIVVGDSLVGWTIRLTSGSGCRIVYDNGTTNQHFFTDDTPFAIPAGTGSFFLDDVTSELALGGAYSIEWCPPA